MTSEEREVVMAAIEWWVGHRPMAWKGPRGSLRHLENPLVNVTRGERLAKAVAALVPALDANEP